MNSKRIVFRPCIDENGNVDSFVEYETNSLTACILLTQGMEFAYIGMYYLDDEDMIMHTGFDFGYDGRVLRDQRCPECGGEGTIPELYSNGYHPGLSNEQAERLAGEVCRTHICPRCNGRGETYE